MFTIKKDVVTDLNSFRSKKWANSQLRFGINVLLGEWGWNKPFSWKYRLFLAEDILIGLKREGFWWQAQILGYWVNRFKRGDFTDGIPPLAKDPGRPGDQGPGPGKDSQPKADARRGESLH